MSEVRIRVLKEKMAALAWVLNSIVALTSMLAASALVLPSAYHLACLQLNLSLALALVHSWPAMPIFPAVPSSLTLPTFLQTQPFFPSL